MIESRKNMLYLTKELQKKKVQTFDTKILAANYNGIKGPLLCINYKNLKKKF